MCGVSGISNASVSTTSLVSLMICGDFTDKFETNSGLLFHTGQHISNWHLE